MYQNKIIMTKDFRKYAIHNRGINGLVFDEYTSIYNNYVSPTIIEERTLNIATMDVFSRLMMAYFPNLSIDFIFLFFIAEENFFVEMFCRAFGQ